jgi:N-acetylneuraminate synthase
MTKAIYIIAEAGVNHNGEEDMAFALVDAAKLANVDAVKFQTFKAELVATDFAGKAEYQKTTTGGSGNQLDMIRKFELGHDAFKRIKAKCDAVGIQFLSTPFDVESCEFLTTDLELKTLKISSGEITHGALLLSAARSGCDIILSTGMTTLDEIEDALKVIAFGYTTEEGSPTREMLDAIFDSPAGKSSLANKVVLLHCTTEYPAPSEESNLKAIGTMRDKFGLRVGFSDHTEGISVSVTAAARGAEIIEKHFTLDKTLEGPDHKASLEPDELINLVNAIRKMERSLGEGEKQPSPSEIKNIPIARKSLVARHAILKGDLFSEENLVAKRPGGGLSPMAYWDLLGRPAARNYQPDEAIDN